MTAEKPSRGTADAAFEKCLLRTIRRFSGSTSSFKIAP